ncbi:MAG: hypothetical protein IPP48_16395 [Chitinophagaceae bacterium]|nr:hypothetical protein [Chitinophagaceae bacterium]
MKIKDYVVLMVALFFSLQALAQNKIEIEFKTGEDDLRGIGTPEFSPDIKLLFVNKPEIIKRAINSNATWPKNSIRKITIPLDTSMVIGDLLAMELTRKHSNTNVPTTKSPDNWDIDRIIVTATFKKNGQTTKYELLNSENTRPKLTPWRMTYENSETPKRFDFRRNPTIISGSGWIDKFPPPQKTSIATTIGVGGDDLRGGGDNAKIVITFKNSSQKLVFNNINKGQNWGNFSEHQFISNQVNSIANVTTNDIKTVELWHTGGGGMGADNWDIDKLVISITINGVTKQLVDKTGTPLHRFTGDTRRKTFVVE